ncbi:hypothetical protein BFP71_09450 [Roseivirga misakiensis]|uniref:Uncharacterized protein n=1 Tax=Roseivirga misakiensis TaxID=1563681 RepID=A0A1E5SKW9_9BACT|nr:hypothetical protein BFP71_09450 [Roseivirga misakiensis]
MVINDYGFKGYVLQLTVQSIARYCFSSVKTEKNRRLHFQSNDGVLYFEHFSNDKASTIQNLLQYLPSN